MPTPFVKRTCQVGQVGHAVRQARGIVRLFALSNVPRCCPTYPLTQCVGWTLFAQQLRQAQAAPHVYRDACF